MDYTAVASNNGEGVDILDDNGNYKNTYEILKDISAVYKEIQEEDKKFGTNRASALIEELAGKNRAPIAASILSNPDLLTAVKETSLNSAGSGTEENEKYLQSVEARLKVLNASFQNLWANAVDPSVLNFFIDLGSNVLNLVDDFGLLNTALAAITTFASFKGVGGTKYTVVPILKMPTICYVAT